MNPDSSQLSITYLCCDIHNYCHLVELFSLYKQKLCQYPYINYKLIAASFMRTEENRQDIGTIIKPNPKVSKNKLELSLW